MSVWDTGTDFVLGRLRLLEGYSPKNPSSWAHPVQVKKLNLGRRKDCIGSHRALCLKETRPPAVTSWAAFLASASRDPMVKKQVHHTPKPARSPSGRLYTTPLNQHILLLAASSSSCDFSPLSHTAASAPIYTTGFLLSPGGLWPEGSTSSHCWTLSPFYLKGFQLSLRFTVNVTLSLLLGSLAWLPCPNITLITLSPLQTHPVLSGMWAHLHCLTTSCLCVHVCTMSSKRARTKSHLSLEP